jgi:endonuclease/exonuclease/phosphatase family metal-dependent hydrolase
LNQSRFFALVLVFLAAGCARELPAGPEAAGAPRPPPVTVMTFNVENLFDNRHDAGKQDRTYLPLAMKQSAEHRAACAGIESGRWRAECLEWDWSDEIVARKLSVVAAAILQVGGGRGPDVLALQEIENVRILERLSRDYLAAADYEPAILIEGDDERGIDVAFLTRLPLAAPAVLHRIAFEDIDDEQAADTRGILEATFRLPDGTLLTGYAVHFPAPFHPTEMRIAAYQTLNRLLAGLPEDRPAFAAGDFNTTSEENRAKHLLDRFARPHWLVLHDTAWRECKGTSYYAPTDDWSFLDMILWARRSENTTWHPDPGSVALANRTPAQVRADGTPARFTLPGGEGVSDHWPLVVTLEAE